MLQALTQNIADRYFNDAWVGHLLEATFVSAKVHQYAIEIRHSNTTLEEITLRSV